MSDNHDHSDNHDQAPAASLHASNTTRYKAYIPAIVALVLLLAGLAYQHLTNNPNEWIALAIFGVAYIIVGGGVVLGALKGITKGEFFDEKFLMSIATIGAFLIGEYAEGVAVMLFYEVGELFQHAALNRAKRSIQALLDLRPEEATVVRDGKEAKVHPREVELGDIVRIRPGEQVPLDGELLSDEATLNTAALTGESVPQSKKQGEPVLAGMINLDRVAEFRVTARFTYTKLAQVLRMVQDAAQQKAKTQLFISKFAKVYTPIVVGLAILITFAPALFVEDYEFREWVYRALVFLVISCPCGLVISVPLGYFGGIGAAARKGILFKGSNFLDIMTQLRTVVTDKTGTLTEGSFKVREVVPSGISEQELINLAAPLERNSTHPVAQAVVAHGGPETPGIAAENVEEISGHGMSGTVAGRKVLAGNLKLLRKFNITYPVEVEQVIDTLVAVAVDGTYAGYLTVADKIKPDARQAVDELHAQGIKVVMLSGDKDAVTQRVAKELGIDQAFGDLLPEGKVEKVKALKAADTEGCLAFVGDGINDAPVVALADVGMAMGGLGSDATIETADVVIQNDQPSRIATAIKIGRATRKVVWQNITLALGIKVVVLILGAGGLATLWEAVFADVGVALLAILNAVRIQRMKF